MFQHTAARRRLLPPIQSAFGRDAVSTHSRAKAAAEVKMHIQLDNDVSTHSRAEAAAFRKFDKIANFEVSTHSRAEAAAPYLKKQEKPAD